MAAFFVSCSTDMKNTIPENLSETIQSYVISNYPDATIDTVIVTGETAVATLNTGESLTFDLSGVFIEYSNNAAYGISTDSIETTIDSTVVDTDSVATGHHHGHKHHKNHHGNSDKKHHDNDVNVDSLSTVINDYISENYSGYSIIHANTDTICSGTVTCVFVCDSTSEPIKLVFDTDKKFLMSGVRIQYSDIPEAVTTSVTSNYADYTVSSRCSLYTLADGTVEYKVYLKLEKELTWVMFEANGTVACEKP